MRHRALPLLLLAALTPTCVADGPPQNPTQKAAAPASLLSRKLARDDGALAFPPEDRSRQPRPRMGDGPTEGGMAEAAPEVVSPYRLEGLPHDVTGDRIRIAFNQPMATPTPAGLAPGSNTRIPAAPGTLVLAPETKGRVEWTSAYQLEFIADEPLQVGRRYEVSLGDVRNLAGVKLDSPWHMTVIPRVEIAGKILAYAPTPGEPRIVAMHPFDGAVVGRRPEIAVLYDQPMELGRAQAGLALEPQATGPATVPFVASHPLGPTFQGVEVDRRFVVVMRPVVPLDFGQAYALRAKPSKADQLGQRHVFRVAPPLAVTRVACPEGTDDCSVDAPVATTTPTSELGPVVHSHGRELDFFTSTPLTTRPAELEKHVRVTPPVSNLLVYATSWDEPHLVVSGAFEPSRRYDITVSGLIDRHGSVQDKPFRATLERAPEDASVTMASGVLLLDEARMKAFELTTRNVATAELALWAVDDTELGRAVSQVRAGTRPLAAATTTIEVPVAARENQLVTTTVDLSKSLDSHRRYVAAVRVRDAAFDADLPDPRAASPLALVFPGSAESLAVHVEKLASATLVHVARLGTGEPVSGASLALLDLGELGGVTGSDGLALLAGQASGWLSVTSGNARALVDLKAPDTTAEKLFPSLTSGDDPDAGATRAVVFTDRGIYRPGSTVHVFANLRTPDGARLAPLRDPSVVVRVSGPANEEVFRTVVATSELGSVSTDFEVGKGSKLGRHQISIETGGTSPVVVGQTIVQVAEFEPPRFAVDVDARATDARALRATVFAKYLFGAPMDGAAVKWTARRENAPIAAGVFADAGFGFRPAREPWDERAKAWGWAHSGETKAGADGLAKVEQRLSLEGTVGPQRFVVEAEVSDSSHRAIAGRATAIVHAAQHYAGVRVGRRWVAAGERLPLELAVVDREGKAAEGVSVSALLRRVEYSNVARRDAGGALSYEWTRRTVAAGRCTTKSASTAVTCELRAPVNGSYEVVAEVDGRTGGTTSVWAWNEGASSGPTMPNRGRALDVVADRAAYAPGDTAKLFVTSPFAAATAIVTTDVAGAKPRAQKIVGAAGVVEIPISGAEAPHFHAMVTLLPLTTTGGAVADYRIGAVRLAVKANEARLTVGLTPAKPTYGPREQAEVAIQIADASGKASAAEVAIAVVDEGVLRMTGFHAPDPVTEMRPGRAFAAEIFDTRAGLAELVARSHVAGDGDDDGPSTRRRDETDRSVTQARKNFAQTVFWKADVRTDENGRAVVKFPLPDNLTELRVMAVALDRDGKGGVAETSFTVSKPLLLAPALPRFVALGDSFEAATLVHAVSAANVTVALAGVKKQVALPAGGHVRVGFPVRVACTGEAAPGEVLLCPTSRDGERASLRLTFEARDESGAVLDAVEQSVPATFAGLDEHPRLEGAFAGHREIALRVPGDVSAASGEESVVIALGAQMWPELGERMRYLLDYPHGCVEQTTSSTLPLLAARDIAPRIGMTNVSDADLQKKIRAGLDRFVTMRTTGGGLAYWPGGTEPNTYGTAYAIRALVLAKAAGIEPPADLLDGMAGYLKDHMLEPGLEPEVRAAIAQSLAELGRLDASASDALYDRREEQTVFGAASLALALSALTGQDDRVAFFLDRIEAGIDDSGALLHAPRSSDFHYYGSPARTKAQAAMALRRLRPGSRVLPGLVRTLAGATEHYTTQATAYSLLALAEELRQLPRDASDARVFVDGREITKSRDLDGGGREYAIPLTELAGKNAKLELRSESGAAVGFLVRAAWRRPTSETTTAAFRTASGPGVYRVYTDAKGAPVDLANVHAGDVLRVALLVRRSGSVDPDRFGYLALTDRLPAGFEPVQQDLATVAAQPAVDSSHPLAAWFEHADERASFIELHDDRVNVYFDNLAGDDAVTSYLVRATTPGSFAIPPATAELMYEPESLGATEPARVAIR